jgi:hypothetical protein
MKNDGMFEHGKTYTRPQIATALGGGGLQTYLPTVKGRVVCGCFHTHINPGAPEIILPGDGPVIRGTAETLCAQGGSIPVFLADGNAKWRFVGRYEVERTSTTDSDIAAHRGKRTDVTRVIWLRRVA